MTCNKISASDFVQEMQDDEIRHIITCLEGFLQRPTRLRLHDQLHSWLDGEIRLITTVFINIGGVAELGIQGAKAANVSFCTIKNAIKRFDGGIRQFVIDDKGCVCVSRRVGFI